MIEKDYLPQYAAEAVRDLKINGKLLKERVKKERNISKEECEFLGRLAATYEYTANLIRVATHIVLPPNGEIYRGIEDHPPTEQECESMAGIPAPITAFEYDWTYLDISDDTRNKTYVYRGLEIPLDPAPKRITLVIDSKQIDPDNVVRDEKTRIIFMSVMYSNEHKCWTPATHSFTAVNPFIVISDNPKKLGKWGTAGEVFDLEAAKVVEDEELSGAVFSQYQADISIVGQACHALRVGAVLEARREKSYTRSRTLEKAGVGGFEYHVLRLPHGTVKETLGNRRGVTVDRDGPRYHFRRAHLRNLCTGTQTFVRSCFVGNRDKGVVEKEYKVERGAA